MLLLQNGEANSTSGKPHNVVIDGNDNRFVRVVDNHAVCICLSVIGGKWGGATEIQGHI